MPTFSDISIRFGADLAQFSSQMQNADRQLQRYGKNLQRVGTNLTAGLTVPLLALGGIAVKNFNEQAQAVAQVEAGLRETGNAVGFTTQELEKQAEALQRNSLFGDEDILRNVTAQLLTFTNIAGTQFKRTQQAALDLATRLDGDVKSAAIQLGKALNDPVANLSALSRSGIQFTASQKELINSLVAGGKAAEAQNVILTELERQYGGSAQAAAEAGLGPFTQLRNILGDLTEDFGGIIVDALLPFVDTLKGIAAQFRDLSPTTQKFIVIVGAIAAAIGPLLALAGTILPALATGFAILTGPIGLIVAGLTAIGVVIVRNWEPIRGILIDIANYFIDLYNESLIFRAGVEAITTAFNNIFAVGSFIFESLGRLISLVAGNITETFSSVGDLIKAVLTGNFEDIPLILSRNLASSIASVQDFVSESKEEFSSLTEAIEGNIAEGLDNVLGGRKYELLADNVDTDAVEQKVGDAVARGLANGATGGVGGRSPLDQIGVSPTQGIAQVGDASVNASVVDAIDTEGVNQRLLDFRSRLIDFNQEASSILQDGLVSVFTNAFSAIGDALANGGDVLGAVGSAILSTIGQVAVRLGEAAIGIGLAMNSIKLAFSNPFTAIAAGAALIALGSALGGIANNAVNGTGGGGSSVPSSFSSNSFTNDDFAQELSLRLEGNNLVGAIDRTRSLRNRTVTLF